jgi:hypothetical protein
VGAVHREPSQGPIDRVSTSTVDRPPWTKAQYEPSLVTCSIAARHVSGPGPAQPGPSPALTRPIQSQDPAWSTLTVDR